VRLEGIHHVTCITGDAPRNVDFYTGVLGLRMVKKTVNQDEPTVYHLFYADDVGSAGSDITFFEYPGAAPGRPGAGMVHRITFRVASPEALAFWAGRLAEHGIDAEHEGDRLRFADPEGLGLELAVDRTGDPPLRARHPAIPAEHALLGFDGVRAYARDPGRGRPLLEDVLGLMSRGDAAWEARGEARGATYAHDPAPPERGLRGGGTVHHVAFAAAMDDLESWRERLEDAGARVTGLIDRFWFRSIYFPEPSGVLFEIATLGPGFATDEPLDHLGESLSLPPAFEPLRSRLEEVLTPLPAPGGGVPAGEPGR
jgi:glyoxalase family protein